MNRRHNQIRGKLLLRRLRQSLTTHEAAALRYLQAKAEKWINGLVAGKRMNK